MKGRSASKIKLTSYDELLGGGEETNDIQQVSLEHLMDSDIRSNISPYSTFASQERFLK